jgi:hypothetical protein
LTPKDAEVLYDKRMGKAEIREARIGAATLSIMALSITTFNII